MTQPEETTVEVSTTEDASEGTATENTSKDAAADGSAMQDSATGKPPKSRKNAIRRTLLVGAAFIVGFIIFGIIAIQLWEYSNSVAFCADACHDVHPEEISAFEDSFHANVKCTECHMGRVGTLQSMVLKAGHIVHVQDEHFDKYERPL